MSRPRAPVVAVALAVALVGATAATGCGEGAGGPEPATSETAYGINAQSLEPLASRGRAELMELHLDAIAELGFEFVRANLDWGLIQPAPPGSSPGSAFDWRSTDPWVAALAERGLRWQPTVMGTPTPRWAADEAAIAAGCDYRAPPGRPRDYAGLVAAIAHRYGRDGRFWSERRDLPYQPITEYELWNEPNHQPFWCPRPDPEAWAALALAAGHAIREIDSEARIVSAGLAGFPASSGSPPTSLGVEEFLARALAAEPELPDVIDLVAVHLYGATPVEVAFRLAWFRTVIDATALRGTPLSVNEFGWATRGVQRPAVADEEARAAFVAALTPAIARSSCEVAALALHTWRSNEVNPLNAEDWFGVADPETAEPYPTALAYATEVAGLLDADAPTVGGEAVETPAGPELPDPCRDRALDAVGRSALSAGASP